DEGALYLVGGAASVTLLVLAAFYRGFVISCFDPSFSDLRGGRNVSGALFFLLLVVNLVAAFQALGTLLALGLMILPAIAARFWARTVDGIIPLSVGVAIVASWVGLLMSYYANLPAGPSIVLVAGGMGFLSAFLGRYGSVRAYFRHEG
ncbi:MAG: metal ABC transporter permease, partial [Alphaproteobacteria bacterium]|nr:metal ABC transporter permease [Alphaproteobacteria bacterium]